MGGGHTSSVVRIHLICKYCQYSTPQIMLHKMYNQIDKNYFFGKKCVGQEGILYLSPSHYFSPLYVPLKMKPAFKIEHKLSEKVEQQRICIVREPKLSQHPSLPSNNSPCKCLLSLHCPLSKKPWNRNNVYTKKNSSLASR